MQTLTNTECLQISFNISGRKRTVEQSVSCNYENSKLKIKQNARR